MQSRRAKYDPIEKVIYTDTFEEPIVARLTQLKKMATEKGKIHTMFSLANSFSMDINTFDNFCIQYLFAPEHPRGLSKAAAFDKFIEYSRDSDSINRFFNFLSTSLFNYDKFLYQVEFSE